MTRRRWEETARATTSAAGRTKADAQRSGKARAKTAKKTADAGDGGHNGGLPGQVVLVMQGGGALGAYQVGVYQALHEAGIEPDWVIGTSIGAINGAIIAGNRREDRLPRLEAFWDAIEHRAVVELPRAIADFSNAFATWSTLMQGIAPFFVPNPASWFGPHMPLGVEGASYYTTASPSAP